MANCTMGIDNQIIDFYRLKQFGLEMQIGQIFTAQQYRSQALS